MTGFIKPSYATLKTQRTGFTIVEVAIVLVIIGLIIGGVLVGRNLIRTAEFRATLKDVESFKTALFTFRNKYNGLPGDIDGTVFWGSGITSGNSSGRIDYNNGGIGEEYYFWNHLSLAGLVPGSYTGASILSIPRSNLNNGYYRMSYQTGVYGRNGHMISLNRLSPVYGIAHTAILSPKDTYGLDLKYDDGMADSGHIMGFNEEGVPGCATQDYTLGSGTYLHTSDDIRCKIFFVITN